MESPTPANFIDRGVAVALVVVMYIHARDFIHPRDFLHFLLRLVFLKPLRGTVAVFIQIHRASEFFFALLLELFLEVKAVAAVGIHQNSGLVFLQHERVGQQGILLFIRIFVAPASSSSTTLVFHPYSLNDLIREGAEAQVPESHRPVANRAAPLLCRVAGLRQQVEEVFQVHALQVLAVLAVHGDLDRQNPADRAVQGNGALLHVLPDELELVVVRLVEVVVLPFGFDAMIAGIFMLLANYIKPREVFPHTVFVVDFAAHDTERLRLEVVWRKFPHEKGLQRELRGWVGPVFVHPATSREKGSGE
mmetsp:Transcript_23273/g.58864  ORF Transcript_23273/g.58864 Transcript_23273/m.58864 type:complete len:306 (+) Transcript_23273:231-1148(+)